MMIYLYFDRGWCISIDDRRRGPVFQTYDELVAWALVSAIIRPRKFAA